MDDPKGYCIYFSFLKRTPVARRGYTGGSIRAHLYKLANGTPSKEFFEDYLTVARIVCYPLGTLEMADWEQTDLGNGLVVLEHKRFKEASKRMLHEALMVEAKDIGITIPEIKDLVFVASEVYYNPNDHIHKVRKQLHAKVDELYVALKDKGSLDDPICQSIIRKMREVHKELLIHDSNQTMFRGGDVHGDESFVLTLSTKVGESSLHTYTTQYRNGQEYADGKIYRF
jgi:hypothetical protein